MQLLHPSPGHCVDRQTILTLKCQHGLPKQVNLQPFVDEINALQSYMEKNWFPLAPKTIQHDYDTAYNELVVVNTKLWDLEDAIRRYMREGLGGRDYASIVDNAFAIASLNDQRAQLVQKINALFGITTVEKVYAK